MTSSDKEVPHSAAIGSVLNLDLNIPDMNGELLTGIALATECEIIHALKLPVVMTRTALNTEGLEEKKKLSDKDIVKATLVYLYHQLKQEGNTDRHIVVMMNAASILLKTGSIARRTSDGAQEPDGDWYPIDISEITPEMIKSAADIKDMITIEEMRNAATIVVATKINWFKENHHTGQGDKGGAFTRKVLAVLNKETATRPWMDLAHRIGHWASTRSVLTQLGVVGIQPSHPVIKGTATLRPADDIKLRLKAPPAGTARMAVSYALAKKMFSSPAVVFLPNAEDYQELPAWYAKVTGNPAAYHMGAVYLCGRREEFDDNGFERLLGRAGAWGNIFLKNSTLMKSPHAEKYTNASDYDHDFETACARFRRQRNVTVDRATKYFEDTNITGTSNYATVCKAFKIEPNDIATQVLKKIAAEGAAAPEDGARVLTHDPEDDA